MYFDKFIFGSCTVYDKIKARYSLAYEHSANEYHAIEIKLYRLDVLFKEVDNCIPIQIGVSTNRACVRCVGNGKLFLFALVGSFINNVEH